MSENKEIEQENSRSGQNPGGAKGLIIIIAIIAAVIIGYFVMQSFGKGGSSNVDLSVISDEDRIPLGVSNLQGKWEKYEGDTKYIINFKSDNTIKFTQYDKDGNVTAESDTGTYEAKDDLLYLTMTAGGQAFADNCNAAVSVEKLVIKAVKGSSIFEGVYVIEEETRKELEYLEGLLNGTAQTEASTGNTEDSSAGSENNGGSSTEQQPADITASEEETQTDPPATEPPVTEVPVSSQEVHLSESILKWLNATKEDAWGEDYPMYNMTPMANPYVDVECEGAIITLWFNIEEREDKWIVPSDVFNIQGCPVNILFEPKIQGNMISDLKTLLGDELIISESGSLSAEIDGYRLSFTCWDPFDDNALINSCNILHVKTY